MTSSRGKCLQPWHKALTLRRLPIPYPTTSAGHKGGTWLLRRERAPHHPQWKRQGPELELPALHSAGQRAVCEWQPVRHTHAVPGAGMSCVRVCIFVCVYVCIPHNAGQCVVYERQPVGHTHANSGAGVSCVSIYVCVYLCVCTPLRVWCFIDRKQESFFP